MAMRPCSNNRKSMLGCPRLIPTELHHSRELSGRPWVLCDRQQQLQHEGIQWPWVGEHMEFDSWDHTTNVQPKTELFNIPRPLQL